MPSPERLSNLPQDTQRWTSDREEIQTLRPDPFSPPPGVGLRHWCPKSHTGSCFSGSQERVCRWSLSPLGQQEGWIISSEGKKIEVWCWVLLQGNCPIKITQYIKNKNLYLVLNEHLVLLHQKKKKSHLLFIIDLVVFCFLVPREQRFH